MILRCQNCKSVSIIVGDAPVSYSRCHGCFVIMERLDDDIKISGTVATALVHALGAHDRTETP